jgi:hypothetical protein
MMILIKRVHNSVFGGVASLHFLDTSGSFVSVGLDGILEFWSAKKLNIQPRSKDTILHKKSAHTVDDDILKAHSLMVGIFLTEGDI